MSDSGSLTTAADRLPAPVEEAELRAAVEAVLVVADEPVTAAALAAALGREEPEIVALLESLADEYAGEHSTDSGTEAGGRQHGFVLRHAAGGWRLASAPRFSELVERFVGGATAPSVAGGPGDAGCDRLPSAHYPRSDRGRARRQRGRGGAHPARARPD